MMNKCNNSVRLYDETREDFYGFTVSKKKTIFYHTLLALSGCYRIKVETVLHLFQLYTAWPKRSRDFINGVLVI